MLSSPNFAFRCSLRALRASPMFQPLAGILFSLSMVELCAAPWSAVRKSRYCPRPTLRSRYFKNAARSSSSCLYVAQFSLPRVPKECPMASVGETLMHSMSVSPRCPSFSFSTAASAMRKVFVTPSGDIFISLPGFQVFFSLNSFTHCGRSCM